MADTQVPMEEFRMSEISLLLQEWRLRQLGSEHYMGELKAAAEDLNISDEEMQHFCITFFVQLIER